MSLLLLGTSTPANTTGNAVAIYVSSSRTITVKDQSGNPIPYAQVILFDLHSKKSQVYYTDGNGVVKLPDIPIATWGDWFIEVIKKDYNTGLIYHYLSRYGEAPSTITCQSGTQLIVTITLQFEPTPLENWAKSVYSWLPDPLKPVANWLGNSYGWTKKQVITLLWNVLAKKYLEPQGAKVTSIVYDESTNQLQISYYQGDVEPLTLGILFWITVILAIVTCIVTPYIRDIVASLTGAKVVEEQTKQNQAYSDMLNALNNARLQGIIDDETYRKAVLNITDSIKWQQQNLPSITIPWGQIVSTISVIMVMWLMITLIKTVGEIRR